MPTTRMPVEVRVLLLDPFALGNLSDLIDHLLPDYWMVRMEESGRRLMTEFGIEIKEF